MDEHKRALHDNNTRTSPVNDLKNISCLEANTTPKIGEIVHEHSKKNQGGPILTFMLWLLLILGVIPDCHASVHTHHCLSQGLL